MSKSRELRRTTDIVKDILENEPETRNSDDLLYIKVCERINSICVNLSFREVLLQRKEWGLPPFESVRRCRQKIQASFPELAGCSNVESQRIINEEVFRDYARGMV